MACKLTLLDTSSTLTAWTCKEEHRRSQTSMVWRPA